MRITCAYSGLELQVTHFPASLSNREAMHPIFLIKQKSLLQYLRKWSAGELTEKDSYLLYLALMHSTDQMEFRVPARFTEHTTSIVSQNMEHLARVIGYSNIIVHPHFSMPCIAITRDNADLANSRIWIQDWMQCIIDFQDGNVAAKIQEKLARREQVLHNFIKNVNRPISHYAKILADWAADAAEFPVTPLTPEPGKSVSTREYWKTIIIRCCKAESIFTIPREDLECLIRWCEDNIDHGSLYAHSLMSLLRAGMARQSNFLGDDGINMSLTTYSLMPDDSSPEAAAKQALIDSAPKTEPVRGEYPSQIAYLRARGAFRMAQDYYHELEVATAVECNTTTVTTDSGDIL